MDASHSSDRSVKSSIGEWIEGLPAAPAAYLGAETSKQSLQTAPATRKRKALTEVDGNREAIYDAQDDVTTKTPVQQPRKRRIARRALDDDTPRAKSGLAASHFSFDTNDASSSTSTNRTYASSSSKVRSVSPSKRVGDLQLLERAITYIPTNDQTFPLPAAAGDIISKIKRIAIGMNLVPASLKAAAQDLIDKNELADYNFDPNTSWFQINGAFSPLEVWDRVGEVLDAAALCEGDLCSESAWNSEVHCRLLGISLRGWRSARNVSYMDVTTARIESGNTGLSKMVDYAIILVPDYTMHKEITAKLRDRELLSINHTKAEYVRFKPITVSIETKRPGMDEDNAKVQLGVWAAAHFEKLQLLCGPHVAMPFLPEVIVQGHDWRLKIASMMSDGNIVLHGDWAIGDTRTTIGIYKIIAAVQVLADWSATDYKNWFLRSIIGQMDGVSGVLYCASSTITLANPEKSAISPTAFSFISYHTGMKCYPKESINQQKAIERSLRCTGTREAPGAIPRIQEVVRGRLLRCCSQFAQRKKLASKPRLTPRTWRLDRGHKELIVD